MQFKTADLCDRYGNELEICEPLFGDFGKAEKRGEGQRDVPVRFAGVTFRPGDWLYADEDGVVVARRALHA